VLLFVTADLAFADGSKFVSKQGRHGVIVFIHGLTGDSQQTWFNQDTKISWPDLVARDPRLNVDFDVYTVDYISPLITRAQSIEELTTQVLTELTDAQLFEQYDSVVFIAHSMGGLIAKNMLVKLNTPLESKKLRQVKAVIYLGTPAQGAKSAWWLQWFSWNPQIKDLGPVNANTLLQAIDNNWRRLIDERNKLRERFPQSFCAYETRYTKGLPIVDRASANTWCDSEMLGMGYNHVDIVKPAKRDGDIRYDWTRDRILEAMKSATSSQGDSSACTSSAGTDRDDRQPRVRISIFKHGGNQEAFDQVLGLIKDRIMSIRDRLADAKDVERQYLSHLTDCLIEGDLATDEQVRQRFWDNSHSLQLIDGVVFSQASGARARSRVYLGSLGGDITQLPLDIRVSPDAFNTIKDLYSLATIYALAMDAKRLQKPVALRLQYLDAAITLSKDLSANMAEAKQLQEALKREAMSLKVVKP
jgi:pimeloyl-ACP methyl ester carboxylesterase